MTIINLTVGRGGAFAVMGADGVLELDAHGRISSKIYALPHIRTLVGISGLAMSTMIAFSELTATPAGEGPTALLERFPARLRELAAEGTLEDCRLYVAWCDGARVFGRILCSSNNFEPIPVEGETAGQPGLKRRYRTIDAASAPATMGQNVEDFHRATLAAQTQEIRQGLHGRDRLAGGPYTVARLDADGIHIRVFDESELLARPARAAA